MSDDTVSEDGSFLVTPDVGLLLWVIAAIALILAAAFFIARVAQSRGQRFWLWFFASIVVTPPVAFLALLFVTQRPDPGAAPSPEQPYGAWGVTTGEDSLAGEHPGQRDERDHEERDEPNERDDGDR